MDRFLQGRKNGPKFKNEVESGDLDLDFLKELLIPLIENEEDVDREPPPYSTDKSEKHVLDDLICGCYCRERFEGDE